MIASMRLTKKIEDKSVLIGVVGLGYVGLPLIDAFYRSGVSAWVSMLIRRKVDSLNAGKSYIEHIPSEVIKKWRDEEMMEATADLSRLSEPDADSNLCANAAQDSRDPDLKYVESTAEAIAKVLRPGQLVVLGKYDVSRNDPRCDSADSRKVGFESRRGFLCRVQSRA